MTGPARAWTTTSGSSSAKATRPVWAAEPVVVSTSHGIAIIETRVPHSEIASATRNPTSGVRRPVADCHDSSPPRWPGRGNAWNWNTKSAASGSSSASSRSSMKRACIFSVSASACFAVTWTW